jgi:uncharacterized membrane protein YesL
MIKAFRTIRRAGRVFFEDLYSLFILSVLTTFAFFLIIPFPPALMALWATARRAAEGRIIRVGDWWAALKRRFWSAWGFALINLLALLLMIYNIRFYGPSGNFPISEPGWLSPAFQGTLAALLVFWLLGQIYVLPLMLEQDRPRVLRAIWRSFSLVVDNLVYSLILFLVIAVLLALSTVALGLGFFVAPAAIAVLTVVATRELLGKDDPEP